MAVDADEEGTTNGTEEKTGSVTGTEAEPEAEGENQEGTKNDSDRDSGDGAEGDSESNSGEDSKEESEGDSGGGSEDDSEGNSEDNSGEDSGDGSGGNTEDNSGGDSEEGSKEDSEGNSEDGSDADSGDGSGEDSGDGSGGDSEDDSNENSEGNSEDGSKGDSEGNSEDGSKGNSEGNSEDGSGGNTKDNSEEDSEGDCEDSSVKDSVEDSEESGGSGDEPSEDPENPGADLPVDLIPEVHEHLWSVDWNHDGTCHWHECDVEDCPVAEANEKDGYAEHTYNEDGVCADCGYDSMDGIAVAAQGDIPTYQEAYETMTALKEKYPEGMTWTNFEPYGSKGEKSAYTWKGGAVKGAKSAVGCMAFAFILSDAVFDNLPARTIDHGSFTFDDVNVGDILRVNGNSHSVIVLQKSVGGVTVAEANYKKTVHWGRSMSASAVEDADFIITRYPKGYNPPDDLDDEVAGEGTEGSLNWSLTTGGVLTISGNGAIPDYPSKNPPWNDYDFYTVVIEEGVTGIGDYAFYQSGALSVYIPDSVADIGQNAFEGSALVAVTIPGTVKTIGNNAFYSCANLTSATVSEGVEAIGDNAFKGCNTLAYIDFPASIKSVGTGAFMNCMEMVSVRFMPGSGSVSLGDGLFTKCQRLEKVILPQTADRIGDNMFSSCNSLPELYIPASVRSINEFAFSECYNLGVIYFGGSEAEWEAMLTPTLKAMLKNKKIVCDAVFDDPFATDPDDPGDFVPGEEAEDEPCTNHADADNDGKCDNCGAAMPAGNPGTGDGGEKDPPASGGSNNRPSTGGSGSSSDSSGSSGSSSEESSDNDEPRESGNPTISTTVRQGADGSSIVTETHQDGTVVTITTDATGKVKLETNLSLLGIHTAEQKGEAVALPVPAVLVVKDVSMAPAITVHTKKDQPVKVAIPAVLPTAGTVAVIVNADGSTNVIKNSVPTKNSIVASLPNGATIKIVDNSKTFTDVPVGSWFCDAVSFISARELFYNTAETAFTPDAPMTYAMLTTALARFDGAQTDGGITWYDKGMEWAAARGIQDGTGPDSNITCGQLVTILWKYQGSPVVIDPLSDNGDAGQLGDAQKAMRWAAKNDIASSFGNVAFDPQGQASRAQTAQIIMNFAKKTAPNPTQ
ncbi:hypothetical protein D3Z51_13770 [Clostridiaceae bacterium]|nr:hypothetical protein [Clostridiaceae bacterium]RKI11875.1 hypothetical protein D7V81_13200 [bacterium 1XD21-70]